MSGGVRGGAGDDPTYSIVTNTINAIFKYGK